MTPIHPDDPRLTAHVLGELPPAEAALIESTCWREGDVRAEVEQMRALAEELTFAFAAEKKHNLTPAQQRVVLKKPPVPPALPEAEMRLTAGALGELPPEEVEALARKAQRDRAAALEMELTGMLASLLRQSFAQERPLTLTSSQREQVLAGPEPATVPSFTVMKSVRRLSPAARARKRTAFSWPRVFKAAAAFIVTATLGYLLAPEPRRALTAWLQFSPPAAPAPEVKVPKTPSTVERLLALIESELNRPATASALETPLASHPTDAPAAPAPPVPPETAAAEDPPRLADTAPQDPPRPQPDASALPPPHAGVAKESPAIASRQLASLNQVWLAARPRRLSAHEFYLTQNSPAAHLPSTLGRASYDVMRQFWRDFAVPPPADMVRPEEIINQFDYDAHPAPGQDFGVAIEAATCPWNEQNQLVRVTVAARETLNPLQPLRLTFALRIADTAESERAQLLFWQGLQALLPRLRPEDSVAIMVWGSSQGLVLPPTGGWRHETIREAAARWQRGGTRWPGGDWGTLLAAMRSHHDPRALNRAVIITDGPLDFTGSLALTGSLTVPDLPNSSVALAHLGPRRGHPGLPPDVWQADSSAEAARLLCREAITPLDPVAERVDIQVQFSADHIKLWRPIGFNRRGGSSTGNVTPWSAEKPWLGGQQVTALYEVTPVLHETATPVVNKKQDPHTAPLSVRVRWTPAGTNFTREMTAAWASSAGDWRTASPDFRFAAGAAAVALQLTGDPAALALPFSQIRELATVSREADPFGVRAEFVDLINNAPAPR